MTMNSKPQSERFKQCAIRLEPWGEGDLPLLKKTLGDPVMTRYLGGPESDEQLLERQARYERFAESGKGRMLKIILEATGEAAGKVGYGDSIHNGEGIYEIGWQVLPAFQGQGIASAAVARAIAMARSDGKYRFLHAFPSVDNLPSNAICRKSGFTLVEECDFEYPRGHFMRSNNWRFDLSGGS
ncbi:MAG: GNAT family N-acetyltransferase [Ktedonobacteraceae bacterium]|nr:GNAT family N-acetyltransferase [Ktedonobacteraceae bacterium]